MGRAYTAGFYDSLHAGSKSSSQVIVPLVLELFPTASVVDVGCGTGAWLSTFAKQGVKDILGLDGDYVPRDLLEISPNSFRSVDLNASIEIGRRFDLACSLEVAEHLPLSSARNFVAGLVRAAPVVLFSAAVPGQGGVDHFNEQWQSFWCSLFTEHGFVAVDCIRPRVFADPRVEWWYRQNTLVYCEPARCPPAHTPVSMPYQLDRIDAEFLTEIRRRNQPQSGREALNGMLQSAAILGRALRRRLLRTE